MSISSFIHRSFAVGTGTAGRLLRVLSTSTLRKYRNDREPRAAVLISFYVPLALVPFHFTGTRRSELVLDIKLVRKYGNTGICWFWKYPSIWKKTKNRKSSVKVQLQWKAHAVWGSRLYSTDCKSIVAVRSANLYGVRLHSSLSSIVFGRRWLAYPSQQSLKQSNAESLKL